MIHYGVRTASLSHTHTISDDSHFFNPSALQDLPPKLKELEPSASTSTETLRSPSFDQPEAFNSEKGQEPYISIDDSVESVPVAVPIKGQQEGKKNTKKTGNTSGGSTPVVTVGTVIPRPTKCLLDPDRVSMCSDELLRQVVPCLSNRLSHETRHIDALSNYVNVSAKTYALGHIPLNATWGKYDPYDDRSKELCIPTTNDRIHIWIVGRITTVWFMKNGTPDNQCSVTIMPLSNSLGLQANQLIAGLSSPPLCMIFIAAHVLIIDNNVNSSNNVLYSWGNSCCSLAITQNWW